MNAAQYLSRGYARRLTPDPDGGYTATIQEFPGLVAEGNSAEEALRNLESAAKSWIEATLHGGEKIPPPVELGGYSGKIALRIPRGLHKRAAEMASSEGVSLNQWLVSATSHYLGTQDALQAAVDKLCAQVHPMTFVMQNAFTTFNWFNTVNASSPDYTNLGASALISEGSMQLRNDQFSARGLSWQTQPNTSLIIKS